MGRHKTYVREEVIQKAMAVFWKKGFDGAHLKELVSVTGINRFALYQDFAGKDGLFLECLESYIAIAEMRYYSVLKKKPLGIHNIATYFDSISFDKDYIGCFFINTLSAKFSVHPKTYQVAKDFSRKIERMYLNNVIAAQKSGALPSSTNAKMLSQFFLVMDEGLSTFGITHSKTSHLKEIIRLTLATGASK